MNSDPRKIAGEHAIAFVLRGNLVKEGEKTTLSAELVNTRDNNVAWTETFTAPDGDLFGLQTKLAEKVWTSLGIDPLPLERQQVEKSYTRSIPAYQLYLIGRFQITNRSAANLRKAIETFRSSLAEDANFAPAYVGLADAFALINLYDNEPPPNAYGNARENALKALAIDSNLAEAHASLAYVKFYHERDRAGSELEFRRAIQVNPSYAQAHHWFALVLAAMNRPVEAIQEAQIAQRLDPGSLAVRSAMAMALFLKEIIRRRSSNVTRP